MIVFTEWVPKAVEAEEDGVDSRGQQHQQDQHPADRYPEPLRAKAGSSCELKMVTLPPNILLLLLLYHSRPRVIPKSTSLRYQASSELLLISAEQVFLHRKLCLAVQLSNIRGRMILLVLACETRTNAPHIVISKPCQHQQDQYPAYRCPETLHERESVSTL